MSRATSPIESCAIPAARRIERRTPVAHSVATCSWLAPAARVGVIAMIGGRVLPGPLAAVLIGTAVLQGLRTRPPRLVVRPLVGSTRLVVEWGAAFGVGAAVGGPQVLDRVGSFAATLALAACAGVLVETLRRRIRRMPAGRLRVLVVSAGERAAVVSSMLRRHEEFGIDARPLSVTDAAATRALAQIRATCHDDEIDALVLVEHDLDRAVVQELLRYPDVPVFVTGSHGGTSGFGTTVETLWSDRFVPAPVPADQRPAWRAWALLERLLAGVALVFLSPLLVALSVAVRRSSPGPILFRQERVGMRGETFTILKFRSMPVDHDAGARWNAAHRAEPTRVGAVMRHLSLDELPQLINVVRGEMSLVGPRPELPRFVSRFDEFVPEYADRHRLHAGLTGWAQVHGLRGDTSIVDRARFDNNFIDDWSIGRNLLILVATLRQLLPERLRPTPNPIGDLTIDLRHSTVDEVDGADRLGVA